VPRSRRSRLAARLSLAGLATTTIVFATSSAAFAGPPTQFTPGDLVIYETVPSTSPSQTGLTSAATAVSLVDYSTSGTPSGFAVNMPTSDSGSEHGLTDSGAALNDGLLTDSADGQYLLATGYDDPLGTASVTSSSVSRTVAIVSSAGAVDTTTSATGTTVTGNNFRSATAATSGGNVWLGSGGGTGVTSDGTVGTPTFLDSNKVHEVADINGQLYESTTKNIFQVGTGLPTSGTPTETALLSGLNLPTNFGPDQFAFATLGSGAGPDTLYVADGSNGATSGEPNAVEKYSLESGTWTATGSVTVPLAVGIAVSVSAAGVASLYVTGATSASAANNTVLYGITDSSGFEGSLSGATVNVLANAPANTDFKGLAWVPATLGAATPEASIAVALPLLGLALFGGAYVLWRRRETAGARLLFRR
jgi:hypothetical protein